MSEPQRVPVRRWPGDGRQIDDAVAVEEPLEIRVRGRGLSVTMRTPGHDRELAAGFLLGEGVVRGADELLDVLVCRDLPDGQSGNVVEAVLAPHVVLDFEKLSRHVFATSSCGLCGKATLESIARQFPRIEPPSTARAEMLAALPARLAEVQAGFAATGGLHASALFDADGGLLCVREDVGRHNALDKVAGWALRAGRLPLRDAILLVSGRVSFELVQKALAAGIPTIAGIGAPSSLAVACANESGQTLVGFLREGRFNLYCGAVR